MKYPEKALAVVSGGSNGIGSAIVTALAAEHMTVVNADVKYREVDQENVYYRPCDISQGNQVDQLQQWARKLFGVPEVLVLNAGVGVHEKLTEGDPEKWQKVMDTNVMGALRMIRAFVPAMLERGNGHIIFISSVSAGNPYPYGGVYCASKTALETIAETLRAEVGASLKVSIISPGLTASSFFEEELQGGRSLQDFDMEPADPALIADQVLYAIRQKGNLVINKMIVRPKGQQF